MLLKSYLYLIT